LTDSSIRQFIQKLAQREGITDQRIREIIISAFRDSYCQGENSHDANLHFEFNNGLLVYRTYQIVEKINNPNREITLDNELIKAGEIKDNVLFCPVDTKNLPFSLSQNIRKKIEEDLGKIQQRKEYETYATLQGQLISGKLQSIEDDYCLINLGKGIGY